MSYLVLARKFRPQTFHDIAGQEHITKALANAIVRARVPHALLLTGPRGVGKTTAARVLARALNCNGRELPDDKTELDPEAARKQVEPCGECSNCVEIAKSSSIAVWEIDGASNNSVDNVRELIDSLRTLPPPGSRYKIYIIDEVHMLSTAAFNALLKSLEEPPPNTIFIFATTEPHKIPETVISRCQRHDFRRLSSSVIVEQLMAIARSEIVEVESEVCEFIARKAQGGMRDAQSMFDRLLAFSGEKITLALAQQIFGVLDRSFFFNLSDAIVSQDSEQCFVLLDNAFNQSLDIRTFLTDFITHFRNLLIVTVSQSTDKAQAENFRRQMLELTKQEYDLLKEQSSRISTYDVQRLFDIAGKTTDAALISNYPRYVIEAGVVKMASISSLQPLPELIDKLERSLASGRISTNDRVVPVRDLTPLAIKPEQVLSDVDPVGADFNPSWEDFLLHVKSRSEVVLAAFLRRVVPKHFSLGQLTISAGGFDLSSLKESDNIKNIKNCLYTYSGSQQWSVQFSDLESENDQGKNVRAKALHSPGSLADDEARRERERVRRIDKEARGDPSVKAVLSAFDGSKIEKVSIIKS